MYDKAFSNIYNDYGWDYFSITMGEAILKYFNINNIKINKHLDLGCGVGTLCNLFYKNGISTKGVDASKYMIDIAKKNNSNIEYEVKDMLDYNTNERYDLITLTCDTINHILEESKIDSLFSNIYNMLNKGGYLVFDIINKDKLDINKDICINRDNNIQAKYFITNSDELINTNVKIIKNNSLVYESNIKEKLYDINIIKELLKNSKFSIIKCDNKIMNEEQRYKDKLYFICRK